MFSDDLEEVLNRASEAGVDRILTVGTDFRTSCIAVDVARRYEAVYAAIGIHPHEVSWFDEQAEPVRVLLDEEKVVAVGEIGLDYVRSEASRDAQTFAFRTQMEWAHQRNLPVSVHNRDADADVLGIVQEFGATAILHCFSGSPNFARAALASGCYLSFAGNITFPKADEVRASATCVALDRMLVETDSPVLAPQAWRGRRNEPAHVVATADCLAGLRGMSSGSLAMTVSANADRLFGWRAP